MQDSILIKVEDLKNDFNYDNEDQELLSLSRELENFNNMVEELNLLKDQLNKDFLKINKEYKKNNNKQVEIIEVPFQKGNKIINVKHHIIK